MTQATDAMPDALRQAHEAMQASRPADALNVLQAYLATTPDDVGALNLAGLAQLTMGDVAKLSIGAAGEGVQRLEQAVAHRRGYLPAQFNLGLAYLRTGRATDAVAAFRRVTKADARNAGAWLNLGVAQVSAGMPEPALTSFRSAVRFSPSDPVPARNLANLLVEQDAPADALPIYERLLEKDDSDLVALLGIAAAKERLGARAEAVDFYERVLTIDVDNLPAHTNIAPQLERLGRFDEAEAHLRRATELNDKRPQPVHNLIGYLSRTRQDDAVAPLCEDGDKRWPEDAYFLERLAGHRTHRTGDLEGARRTVETLHERFPQNVAGFELLMNDPERVLTPAHVEALTDRVNGGVDSQENRGRLCFVLFEHWHRQGDHTQAFGFLERANAFVHGTIGHKPNDDTVLTARTIKTFDGRFFDHRRAWGDAAAQPIFVVGMPESGTAMMEQVFSRHPSVAALGELRDIAEIGEDLVRSGSSSRGWPRALTANTEDDLKAAAQRYLAVAGGLSRGAARFADAMPANFRYLGLIATMFPNAKIIHCRRDAMDVCFSIYRHHLHGVHGYGFDMGALANYHRQYARLMAHWAVVCSVAIHDVDHDRLVDDLEGTVRSILDYCDLPFDSACLDGVESPHGSVGAWRDYEEQLAPLAKGLAKGS